MGTECDADRPASAEVDGDPEVIDVRRDRIDFRDEGNWSSDNMNEITIAEAELLEGSALFSPSIRQAVKEKELW